MIIWGIFWGAVLGLMWPNSGDEGWFLGALFGLFGGFSLRWAVRRELKSAHAKRQEKLQPQVSLPLPQTIVAAPGSARQRLPGWQYSSPGTSKARFATDRIPANGCRQRSR